MTDNIIFLTDNIIFLTDNIIFFLTILNLINLHKNYETCLNISNI